MDTLSKVLTSPLGILGIASTTTSSSGGGISNSINGDSNSQWSMITIGLWVLVLSWIVNMVRDRLIMIGVWVQSRLYYNARISMMDPAFMWVLEWLSIQQCVFESRSVSVNTKVTDKTARPIFSLLPMGSHWIRYNGYHVHITRTANERANNTGGIMGDYHVQNENLDIAIIRGNPKILRDLIHDAMEYSINLNKDKTKIFTLEPHSKYWECISVQPKRVVESVVLDQSVRSRIMNDVENFIQGKEWYVNTGVPYRRGYLFYGPPGTGKTSFILSIAGKFNLSISIMNMSKGIHDGNVHSIIQKTPSETILVLEDVDAAFVSTSNSDSNASSNNSSGEHLTFSGLLNALDGLASSDGRILIMTTNHIERLSAALIRPGRIDVRVKFDFATKYQITHMFQRFFPAKHHWMIEQIIEIFGSQKISTAQLQGWFIVHRDCPTLLLDNIYDFLQECQSELNNTNYLDTNSSSGGSGNSPNQIHSAIHNMKKIQNSIDMNDRFVNNNNQNNDNIDNKLKVDINNNHDGNDDHQENDIHDFQDITPKNELIVHSTRKRTIIPLLANLEVK